MTTSISFIFRTTSLIHFQAESLKARRFFLVQKLKNVGFLEFNFIIISIMRQRNKIVLKVSVLRTKNLENSTCLSIEFPFPFLNFLALTRKLIPQISPFFFDGELFLAKCEAVEISGNALKF